MLFGYARVSSADQNPAHQIDALTRTGIDTASLSTDSLEELNLGKISELLKLGITAVSFITALNSLS